MEESPHYRSSITGIHFPALPQSRGAALLSMLWQLDKSQWWSAEKLRAMQQEQLLSLMNHAVQTTPFYRQHLSEAGYKPGQRWDENMWSAIPVLKRQQLQEQHEQLHSQKPPADHGKAYLMQSSGSTGRPVQTLGNDITLFYLDAITLRDHHWWQRDFMQKFAAIRPDMKLNDRERVFYEQWGPPVDQAYHSGPTVVINSRVDVHQQLQWLQEYQPTYLLSLPSNLRELLRLCEQDGISLPKLKQVRSFGESVTQSLRDSVHRVWGVNLSDMYSSQEVGYMALQCPEHEHYHVQAETMYLEVLDENNRACAPGEIGRIVVTPLHNFAMPLIRYEVGDYAEIGEACACGRGLPVLKRIVGRTRNMIRTPEGKCYWPSFPVEDWLKIADIRQFQLRQTRLDCIEAHIAMDGKLNKEQMKSLTGSLQQSLNYPFKIDFHYVDSIPVQKNGKYEDFISLL